MVLKLYSFEKSTCGQRAAMILNEKNVSFELHVVQLPERFTPEFLSKQPFGQVPYIDDDGFILYETRAIARYIEAKYPSQGTKLIPSTKDLKVIALFEQAVSVEVSNFDPHVSDVVDEGLFKPLRGLGRDEAAYEKHMVKLEQSLGVYEKILSKQRYVAGDEFTMADIFHIPYGALVAHTGSDVTTRNPNVARWWLEIASRPSWTAMADGIVSTASQK